MAGSLRSNVIINLIDKSTQHALFFFFVCVCGGGGLDCKPSSSHSISILTNISTQFLLQSVCACVRACVRACVCMCL